MNSKINLDFNKAIKFKNDKEKDDFKVEALHLKIMNQIIPILDRRNISRKDFAKMLCVSESYLSQLFSVDKLLNLKTIIKIQNALNIVFDIKCNTLDKYLHHEAIHFNSERNRISSYVVYEKSYSQYNPSIQGKVQTKKVMTA